MADEFAVRLSPLFGEPRAMQDYIEGCKFDDYLRFSVYEDYCVITFATPDRQDAFVDYFDGRTLGGRLLRADPIDARPARPRPAPPRRLPRLSSHTIAVKGYPPHLLSDRNLWDHFCRLGFIRQIECRASTGYIQFDTEKDALEAFDAMDEATIEGSVVQVDVVEDRMLNLPTVVIPLSVVDREDAPVPPRPRDARGRARSPSRGDGQRRRPHPDRRPKGPPAQEERPRVRDYERPVV
jgi:hypothetical protein